MTDAVADTLETRTVNLDYDGRTGQFAGIVFINLVLQILTLGIFRFWARTRERRYLWSHVSLAGDRLEYTGTGMELFIGFLIAMVGLAVIGGVYQLLLTMFAANPVMLGIMASGYSLLILFLVYFAIYRTRRYRLTRTVWRGIRGTMERASVRYAFLALGYYLLNIVTLGLAAPLMRVGLTRFEVENMRFGDRPFAFDGRAGELFRYWLVPWLILLATVGSIAWLIIRSQGLDLDVDASEKNPAMDLVETMAQIGFVAFLAALIWYRVKEFRYLAGKISFEGMRFSSDLSIGRVVWIYVSFFLIALVTVVALVIAIAIAVLLAKAVALSPDVLAQNPEALLGAMDEQTTMIVSFAIGLSAVVVMQTLARVMVFHRLARSVVTTLAVTGSQDFSQVAQALDTAPATGEGLADAFDLGNF